MNTLDLCRRGVARGYPSTISSLRSLSSGIVEHLFSETFAKFFGMGLFVFYNFKEELLWIQQLLCRIYGLF